MKHRNRAPRRINATFRTALLGFLARQMMTEVAHSLDGGDEDGGVQVQLTSHGALFEVADIAISPEKLAPVHLGKADSPTADDLVFQGGGDLSGADGAPFQHGDLLNIPETIAATTDDGASGDVPKRPADDYGNFAATGEAATLLYDRLFPAHPLDDQGFG